MTVVFYIAGVVALISTLLVITRRNTLHALLYLVVSLLAVAVVFYALGAPFVAALEVIVYAGAIIVLFLFTVMLLNIGRDDDAEGEARLHATAWIGPGLLAVVLLAELAWAISTGASAQVGARVVGPREVGVALYGPYAIGVELASTLLLAALIGARHLGQRQRELDPGLRQTAAAGATGGLAGGAATNAADVAAVQGEAADVAATQGEAAALAAAPAAAAPTPAAPDSPAAGDKPSDTRFWRKDDD